VGRGLIARGLDVPERKCMLRRAGISCLVALTAAPLGFGGLLSETALLAQGFFYVSAAFVVLSLLLSMFECPQELKVHRHAGPPFGQ